MLRLLIKTLGLSFYQQHAGLFLVVFYLLFGAVEGSQLISYHLAILMAICSSPLVLLLLFAIWVLYSIKAVLFIHKKLALAEYQFVKNITSIATRKQQLLWFKVYCFLLLPILIYAGFIVFIALKHQFYSSLLITVLGLFSVLYLLSVYTFQRNNYVFKPAKVWVKLPVLKINRPFGLWPIFYLLNEQKLMFLVCKVVSILFFKAILLLFADVGNDIRVYLTAMLAVALSHAILIFNLIKFDAFYQAFANALPIANWKRLMNWMVVLLLLLLPEFGLLIWFTTFNWAYSAIGIVFSAGLMLSLFTLVYSFRADMESYMKCLLFFFFVSMLAILAGYYLLFSLLSVGLAIGVFLWIYPKIELKDLA